MHHKTDGQVQRMAGRIDPSFANSSLTNGFGLPYGPVTGNVKQKTQERGGTARKLDPPHSASIGGSRIKNYSESLWEPCNLDSQ